MEAGCILSCEAVRKLAMTDDVGRGTILPSLGANAFPSKNVHVWPAVAASRRDVERILQGRYPGRDVHSPLQWLLGCYEAHCRLLPHFTPSIPQAFSLGMQFVTGQPVQLPSAPAFTASSEVSSGIEN